MIGIEKYEELADSLFRVSLEADLLKNNSKMDIILDKLIADTEYGYIQIIKFIRGFQNGTSDAEKMRSNINIVENITKDNYKELSFPLPLDKIDSETATTFFDCRDIFQETCRKHFFRRRH